MFKLCVGVWTHSGGTVQTHGAVHVTLNSWIARSIGFCSVTKPEPEFQEHINRNVTMIYRSTQT